MSPLEKVFFLKNMCHTGASNGGKKWRMALFQVDSTIQNSFHGKNGKRTAPESPHRKANDNNSNMISELLG